MKISGFTITRNAVKYGYPLLESIRSILPVCDEFIVNLGNSEDGTLELILSLDDPRIKIMHSVWDMGLGKEVLAAQTNQALAACTGDWAFYLQSDEVVHERDLPRLRRCMERHLNDGTDALRFKWFHFYGSSWRYRVDAGWYQKQDRIVRNNGQVESLGDAWGFRRKDGKDLRRKPTGAYIYHYGWVQAPDVMAERRKNAEKIGFVRLDDHERKPSYSFGDLNRFPVYFGTHPQTMEARVLGHAPSNRDCAEIRRKFWWHPFYVGRIRYKTFRRVKQKIT